MELTRARGIVEEIRDILEGSCDYIRIVGSIRRNKPYVGDGELLCIPKFSAGVDLLNQAILSLIQSKVLDYRLNKLGRKVYGPKNKLLIHCAGGLGIDIFSTTQECWFVSLVVRTGGKVTNMRIATAALRRGYHFHAYGAGFSTPQGEIVCHSESDVFNTVGLPYLAPHLRD